MVRTGKVHDEPFVQVCVALVVVAAVEPPTVVPEPQLVILPLPPFLFNVIVTEGATGQFVPPEQVYPEPKVAQVRHALPGAGLGAHGVVVALAVI